MVGARSKVYFPRYTTLYYSIYKYLNITRFSLFTLHLYLYYNFQLTSSDHSNNIPVTSILFELTVSINTIYIIHQTSLFYRSFKFNLYF